MFQLVRDLIAALKDLATAMQENSKTANAIRSDWAVIGRRITASEERADEWYLKADGCFQRVERLENCYTSPEIETPPLLANLMDIGQRVGKLQVELMKQSAKKPRKRKAKP